MWPLCGSLQTHISCLICQNWNWIMHKGTRPEPVSFSWPRGLSDHVFWCFSLPFSLNCSLHFPFLHKDKGFCPKVLCSSTTRMPMQQLVTIITKGWNRSQAAVGRLEELFTSTTRYGAFFLFVFFFSQKNQTAPLSWFFSIFLHCLLHFSVRSPAHSSALSRLSSFLWFFSFLLVWPLHILSVSPTLRPPPGDIQSCGCPVSRHRLSLPGPERLVCPTGPWQCVPHAYWRRTYTHWTIHVLLLCHFACTGTNPWRCCEASLVVWQMFSILVSVHFWWSACQRYTLVLLWVCVLHCVISYPPMWCFHKHMSPECRTVSNKVNLLAYLYDTFWD